MRMILLFCTIVVCFSCKHEVVAQHVDDAGNEYYGEKITKEDAISIDKLLVLMETKEVVKTKIKGKIASVCKVKGCWMNVESEDNDKETSIFVKFKDYGFFMPLDSDGQTVVMRGKAFMEITSVEELKHYAEDEGKSEADIAAITKPREELKFEADGVVLMP